MTIPRAFVGMLEEKGYGIFGQNIYLYRVPNSRKTETELLWVIPSGGAPVGRNKTGEAIKAYQFLVYFRSNEARRVDNVLSELEETLNCAACVSLKGFELVEISATQFPADQDLDSENRMVGFIRVQLQVYKGCNKQLINEKD